ncbi:MAG: hypothetical protein R2753_13200 [Chitinophagales bacterium]
MEVNEKQFICNKFYGLTLTTFNQSILQIYKNSSTFASVKIIALILSLNILVATNGIAISEHFCSKMSNTENTQNDVQSDENCCHTNYIGFEKQDIEGNISSSIILKKIHQNLLILHYSLDVLSLKKDFKSGAKVDYPPPTPHCLPKTEASQLQVFRC